MSLSTTPGWRMLGLLTFGLLAGVPALSQASSPTPATTAPASPSPTSSPAGTDWEGQVIYQVMPDRFMDGDSSNNAGVNRQEPGAWHGGDLKGLAQRLDYIRELGATALWMTPVYKQVGPVNGTAGYHGYWPADFRALDPHFGTLADFKALTAKAHGLGLKVMLDQVINHYGYGAPATTQHPGWFHAAADCAAAQGGARDRDCPLAGLPDLNQRVPEVRELLLGNAGFWREQGVDAFRYDAVKHVDQGFLKELVEQDRAAGRFTLGEYYGADAGTIREYQELGLSSLFDFALQDALKRGVMGGQSLDAVRQLLAQDAELPGAGRIALFLDNHDLPRFANGSLFEDQGQERTAYGLRALMTLRGVPVIWQGSEIAQRGGPDPDNRRDMRFPESWTPQERAVFGVAQDAIRVRKASPALSRGAQTLLALPDAVSDDLMVFTRTLGQETVLVAWNNSASRRTYSLRSPLAGQGLTPSLYHEPGGKPQAAGLSVRGGFLHLSLPPRTAAVFELAAGSP